MPADFALQFTAPFISGLIGSGIFVFIFRTWISERLKNAIKNEYDCQLETHKAQLKAESDVEIEKLRSELARITREHDIVFSKLHEKRGDAIEEIYADLRRVELRLSEYVKVFEPVGEKPREERHKELFDAHLKFHDTYRSKVIFFPKAIADKLDGINKEFVKAGNEFNIFVLNQNNPDRYKIWTEIAERCDGKIKDALQDLAKEFRSLLGDKGDYDLTPTTK